MKAATMSLNAILHGHAAETSVPQTSLRFEAARVTHGGREAPPVHLTPRQIEVLSLLCEGLPNKLICRQLNIATGTVKVHVGIILRALGVSSRLQAVVAAQRCGLVGGYVVGTPAQEIDSAPSGQLAIAAGAAVSRTSRPLEIAA